MDKKYVCTECGCRIRENELVEIDGACLCQSCAERITVVCRECGARIWRVEAYDDNLCEHCYDNFYTTCTDCESVISYNDVYYTRSDEDAHDYPYCESCYRKHENDEIIHDYYYKPEPIFYNHNSGNDYTNKLYLGVELEVDEGGEDIDCADKILDIANGYNEHIYIKHDGSLSDGFEIVTHPMTFAYHKNVMPWHDVLIKAVHMGYVSHNTDTCGLHIHVSRSAFGSCKDKQETVVARLVYFFEKFWPELLRFSRRTELQANHWAARYGGAVSNCKQTFEDAKKLRLGRYTAVNLCNKHTIEFRIFRGTLRYETLIATLEFINCLCMTAISSDDDAFHNMSWAAFVKKINAEEYPELISYLKNRKLYINEQIEESEEIR